MLRRGTMLLTHGSKRINGKAFETCAFLRLDTSLAVDVMMASRCVDSLPNRPPVSYPMRHCMQKGRAEGQGVWGGGG